MHIYDKSRIYWACRRGMLELDVAIMPFFKYEYDTLSDTEKKAFVGLLKSDDPDIFYWIMNYGAPADPDLKHIVTLIQQSHHERGPVAQ
ncbi:FAD assembly factor SdhE [Pantoea sp. Nvir]|uniref:FAD assembly factor SdhE n=1 Tax=Pantoea sp. Nvir TaxID=2576760 RepID=UPI00135ACD6C|nr:FAD assembly factor SdhE [Pantoea sp. Nvir]MXP66746.1 FAD assembly factor SdhE [Pantoea sp. Nvir]CAJ0990952.1 FAD assembly factor SdhE [Pantoea sp. Nvir]